MVEPSVTNIVAAAGDSDVKPKLLGHGDPWAHNVMLRRDATTGKVNGVALVDLGNIDVCEIAKRKEEQEKQAE